MAYNNKTTIGEILDIKSRVFAENDVFKIGKKALARKFLQSLLDAGEDVSDEALEASYKDASQREGVPNESADFWAFIEKQYLELKDEPRNFLADLALRVSDDLVAVDKYIAYIKSEVLRLEEEKRQNGRLTAEDRYYRNQLEYFEKKNLIAKGEILDYMANRMRGHAISKASSSRFNIVNVGRMLFGDSPYPFGRRLNWAPADPYDVRELDGFANKFMDLPLHEYKRLVKDLKQSPEKFKELAIEYINGVEDWGPSARSKLEKLIGKSHILNSRKQVIQAMLEHFESKDYISFVSMPPLQIEGIFADICREIGVSESQLDISSLNDKLTHIDNEMWHFHSFEYYSFKFPVLRNLVAHGGLVDGDLEDVAVKLMLDLLPVCELAASDELPVMKAIKVLREASEGQPKKLVEWLDLRKSVVIPDFYATDAERLKADACFSSDSFWAHLEGELKKVESVGKIKTSEAVKIAGKVKAVGLATERAEQFLKSSGRVASEAIKRRTEKLENLKSKLF